MLSQNQVPLTVSVRAYAEPVGSEKPKKPQFVDKSPASKWSLIFDTETTTDQRQELRFAFYQLRNGDALHSAGAVYNESELTTSDIKILKQFAVERQLELMPVQEFIDKVFLEIAYSLGSAYIGFNLPFDLSRLAIRHVPAKPSKGNFSMVDGFSFSYSDDKRKPKIQVKHLSSRNSLIRFTVPYTNQQSPSMRRRGIYMPDRRGHFIDVMSLASALLSGSWNLASLANFLGTEHRKLETEEHGAKLTKQYLEYAYQDVQVTWECYVELAKRYSTLKLGTRIEKIISEASLGKAYLDQMGIQPWRVVQPDFPKELIGSAMASYYGGRAEVHARRIPVPAVYCDFLSMYPTVCALMNLWRFVISIGMAYEDATSWTIDFLESVTLSDMQNPEAWKLLTVLVRVLPDSDVFPIRAKYDGSSRSIGLNKVSSNQPMWFTLADCIASKLFTGKAPKVIEAVRLTPCKPQENLRSVDIAGNLEYRVDPIADDFLKKVIENRMQVKKKLRNAVGQDKERLQSEQQALKICANATSYGIYVELNPNRHGVPVEQLCYGNTSEPFKVNRTSVEEPGRFFNPFLATFITGAARLMLGMSEQVALSKDLTWAFCDTDGIAFTPHPSTKMSDEDLFEAVSEVRDWFKALSPYAESNDILKLEDENFSIDNPKEQALLYCFAISAKRYALFNIGVDDSITLRKATAHGLGHLSEPYNESNAPDSVPEPRFDYRKSGLKRWHCDLWHQIVKAGLDGKPELVDLDALPGLEAKAVSRYTATTPELLDWFKIYNGDKQYCQQVKPFNFMLSYRYRTELFSQQTFKVSAPYNKDLAKGVLQCFDRETGKPVPVNELLSVRESLRTFHLHPESKFEFGNYVDVGFTARKHVQVLAIEHIGKEAHRWEDSVELGEILTDEQEYGHCPKEGQSRLKKVIEQCRRCNRRKLASVSEICLREITRVLTGKVIPTSDTLLKMETASMNILGSIEDQVA